MAKDLKLYHRGEISPNLVTLSRISIFQFLRKIGQGNPSRKSYWGAALLLHAPMPISAKLAKKCRRKRGQKMFDKFANFFATNLLPIFGAFFVFQVVVEFGTRKL